MSRLVVVKFADAGVEKRLPQARRVIAAVAHANGPDSGAPPAGPDPNQLSKAECSPDTGREFGAAVMTGTVPPIALAGALSDSAIHVGDSAIDGGVEEGHAAAVTARVGVRFAEGAGMPRTAGRDSGGGGISAGHSIGPLPAFASPVAAAMDGRRLGRLVTSRWAAALPRLL
jgi:hypothetical protein